MGKGENYYGWFFKTDGNGTVQFWHGEVSVNAYIKDESLWVTQKTMRITFRLPYRISSLVAGADIVVSIMPLALPLVGVMAETSWLC